MKFHQVQALNEDSEPNVTMSTMSITCANILNETYNLLGLSKEYMYIVSTNYTIMITKQSIIIPYKVTLVYVTGKPCIVKSKETG